MSLLMCPECDNQCSSGAVACPRCGLPLKRTVWNDYNKALKVGLIGSLLILVGYSLVIAVSLYLEGIIQAYFSR